MSDNTSIEWSDSTWNVVTGCTKVSPGCDHCYAETFAERWRGTPGHHFENGFDLTLRPERLEIPLRWKKPRKVFVNSMSDLFHADVPDEFIARAWAVMALAPQHTFQVLTKRHGRMHALLNSSDFRLACEAAQAELIRSDAIPEYRRREFQQQWWSDFAEPLRNVWLGVSTENQKWADVRIPALLDTPAAVRWISAEPLLGPLDLTKYVCAHRSLDRRADDASRWVCRCGLDTGMSGVRPVRPPRLDWVVVGGESGPGARPMHPSWGRSLRDQCTTAGVPFLFKQHGAWIRRAEATEWVDAWTSDRVRWVAPDGSVHAHGDFNGSAEHRKWAQVQRVSKKAAGRELDGRTWDEYPKTRAAVT